MAKPCVPVQLKLPKINIKTIATTTIVCVIAYIASPIKVGLNPSKQKINMVALFGVIGFGRQEEHC